ncbi:MAG: ABC transporter ATP-binding protein [Propionibacteriaceae bacterium]|nr:ABC transporter ATP-binding protein [Propionibacteriaceae bacterium]
MNDKSETSGQSASSSGSPDDKSVLAAAFSLKNVSFSVPSGKGTLEILENVSFSMEPSEIVGIVGRSGTGKTTLLRLLGGLMMPTSGSVELNGRKVDGPPPEVVTVFQDYVNAILPWRNVRRNVGLALEGKVPKDELNARVMEALTMVQLETRTEAYPWQLSGGMQQRLQIARALVLRPQVLLMDEPFGALDAITKAELQDEFLQVHEEIRSTVLFVTHDLEEAIYLSDKVMVIAGPPGHISTSVKIDLPRPRNQVTTKEHPNYIAARHTLHDALDPGAD